jgi:hypothetical protein
MIKKLQDWMELVQELLPFCQYWGGSCSRELTDAEAKRSYAGKQSSKKPISE